MFNNVYTQAGPVNRHITHHCVHGCAGHDQFASDPVSFHLTAKSECHGGISRSKWRTDDQSRDRFRWKEQSMVSPA